MNKDVIIIGAGNVGGFLALNQDLFDNQYKIIGFLDDDETKVGKKFWEYPVLGTIDSIVNYKDAAIAIGISNPRIKKKILTKIGEHHVFPNFIAKNAWLSNKVSVGKGAIIYPGVSINHESAIGDFVVMNMNCAIGHNSTIERCCALAPNVSFGGFTYVESYVDIGIGVSTIQGVRIGEGTIIGGQSMLIENADSNATYVGVPARKKQI